MCVASSPKFWKICVCEHLLRQSYLRAQSWQAGMEEKQTRIACCLEKMCVSPVQETWYDAAMIRLGANVHVSECVLFG